MQCRGFRAFILQLISYSDGSILIISGNLIREILDFKKVEHLRNIHFFQQKKMVQIGKSSMDVEERGWKYVLLQKQIEENPLKKIIIFLRGKSLRREEQNRIATRGILLIQRAQIRLGSNYKDIQSQQQRIFPEKVINIWWSFFIQKGFEVFIIIFIYIFEGILGVLHILMMKGPLLIKSIVDQAVFVLDIFFTISFQKKKSLEKEIMLPRPIFALHEMKRRYQSICLPAVELKNAIQKYMLKQQK